MSDDLDEIRTLLHDQLPMPPDELLGAPVSRLRSRARAARHRRLAAVAGTTIATTAALVGVLAVVPTAAPRGSWTPAGKPPTTPTASPAKPGGGETAEMEWLAATIDPDGRTLRIFHRFTGSRSCGPGRVAAVEGPGIVRIEVLVDVSTIAERGCEPGTSGILAPVRLAAPLGRRKLTGFVAGVPPRPMVPVPSAAVLRPGWLPGPVPRDSDWERFGGGSGYLQEYDEPENTVGRNRATVLISQQRTPEPTSDYQRLGSVTVRGRTAELWSGLTMRDGPAVLLTWSEGGWFRSVQLGYQLPERRDRSSDIADLKHIVESLH